MAVRCSLLGHSFGESEVDRTREERGSEVVVTLEEYEVCSRCGKRNVLSENTEVKRIADADETPVDAGEASIGPDGRASTRAETSGSERAPSSAESGAESDANASPAGRTERSEAASSEESEPVSPDESTAVPTDENGEPITDDAEILDDTSDDASTRERGEWPDSEDADGNSADPSAEPAAWPDTDDVGAEPTESDAGPAAWPDADRSDAEAGASDTAHPPDSEPPETAESTAESQSTGTADANASDPSEANPNPTPASGIESAGEAPEPGSSVARDGVATVFFCPRCSFVAPSDRASLRAGDICPECKKGYLGERER